MGSSGSAALGTLSRFDLLVVAAYMLALFGAGAYFTRQKKTLKTYLLADQNVHWVIVGVSVLAALFSGISYLGAPAESFFHDLQYLGVIASFCIATPITIYVFVPIFRRLQLFTAYEYFERRFDARIRRIASSLFILRVTFYLALAIYAPALALMEVTGWPFWIAVLMMGLISTAYTVMGGMKAVIVTDTLQFVILCGGILLILAFAIQHTPGGLSIIWRVAVHDNKTRLVDFSFDPRDRITIWAALLGGTCFNLVQLVTDQIAVQRYLTAPTLKDTERALWLKFWVTLPLIGLFYLTGTVLYGFYRVNSALVPRLANSQLVPYLSQRAPVPGTAALTNDRLLPYFITHQLPTPLPGLLIAAILGATIAVVSAGTNSLATAALMDFRKTSTRAGTEDKLVLAARRLTALFGLIPTLMALFIMQYLGSLIEAIITISGVFGGPLLGMFFLGVLSKRSNGNGALLGALVGGAAGILIAFSKQLFAYPISFLWISFVSAFVTFGAGWLGSLVFPITGAESAASLAGQDVNKNERSF